VNDATIRTAAQAGILEGMTDPGARTARRRTIVGTGLVVALAAVLVAIVVVRSGGEKVLNENGDTLVLVGKASDNQMMSQIGGELVDVGGCLGLVADGLPVLVVWPHGTTIKTPDPLRVTIDGETYAVGDTVTLGGGMTGPLRPSSFFHDRVPSGCRSADAFAANDS
jgi:hypothetical protein